MEKTYGGLCKKLGFDIDSYEPVISDHEDDSRVSPFSVLSDDELVFLIERRMKMLQIGNGGAVGSESVEKPE